PSFHRKSYRLLLSRHNRFTRRCSSDDLWHPNFAGAIRQSCRWLNYHNDGKRPQFGSWRSNPVRARTHRTNVNVSAHVVVTNNEFERH
ncbi:MAG: hypothetical protein M1830_007326, partial [Pleopsidium flavum]